MDYSLEEYIKLNKCFLYKIASFYARSVNGLGIEFEDLYQVGCLALIEKYHEYDATKGAVSTFSHWVIKTAILKYICNNSTLSHVPKPLVSLSRRYAKENEMFYIINGRNMTLVEQEELLKKFNVDGYKKIRLADELNKINLYNYMDKIYSIYDEIENYDIYSEYYEQTIPALINDCITDNSSIELEVISKLSIEEFIKSLTYLKEKEKAVFIEVLGLYDDIPKTFMFLAEKYGVSYQQTNKYYHQALRKIKSHTKK